MQHRYAVQTANYEAPHKLHISWSSVSSFLFASNDSSFKIAVGLDFIKLLLKFKTFPCNILRFSMHNAAHSASKYHTNGFHWILNTTLIFPLNEHRRQWNMHKHSTYFENLWTSCLRFNVIFRSCASVAH